MSIIALSYLISILYSGLKLGGEPVFCLFGQGLLERDKCLKTLELCAEKVMPRFQD